MLEYINKLVIFFQKKKLLTQIRVENKFFKTFFAETLEFDESELRGEISKLRAIKQPLPDSIQRMQELETQVNKLSQVRQRLSQSENIEKELLCIIAILQKDLLW